MKTIIHDLNEKDIKKVKFSEDDKVISASDCKYNCIGCFSCWIKHPKKCAIKDGYSKIVDFLKESDELVLISKNRYGCYSTSVKRVLERCIGYVLPYFTIRDKEIHHQSRYNNPITLSTYFYGTITKEDKICLEKLVKANSVNLNTSNYKVNYISNVKELDKCIR